MYKSTRFCKKKYCYPIGKNLKIIFDHINNTEDLSKDSYYLYGYEVLGPLLYGYCQWIHNMVAEDEIEKLFFCSRDGYLIRKVYNALFENDIISNEYIYISRKASHIASYSLDLNLNNILGLSSPNKRWNYYTFMEELGIEEYNEYINAWEKCDLSTDQVLTTKQLLESSKVGAFFNIVKNVVEQKSYEQYRLIKNYLNSIDFIGKVGFVEVGWNGTSQSCLEQIVDSFKTGVKVKGYYLSLNSGYKKNIDARAYLPTNMRINDTSFGLIEFPLSPREGSLKKYTQDWPFTELYEYEYSLADSIAKENIQDGTIAFVKSIKTMNLSYDANDASYNMNRIAKNPTLKEANMFGDVSFKDTEINYIAKPKTFMYYVLHIKALRNDFNNSTWKSGFLKRLFIIPLNYYWFLRTVKKLTKR